MEGDAREAINEKSLNATPYWQVNFSVRRQEQSNPNHNPVVMHSPMAARQNLRSKDDASFLTRHHVHPYTPRKPRFPWTKVTELKANNLQSKLQSSALNSRRATTSERSERL